MSRRTPYARGVLTIDYAGRGVSIRRKQGGASSAVVSTGDASAVGSGLREAGRQLSYRASIGASRAPMV